MNKAGVRFPSSRTLPVTLRRAVQRCYAIGAELHREGVHFRVWAPQIQKMRLVCEDSEWALTAEGNGYFSLLLPEGRAGLRYRFGIGDDPQSYPDPASRFQPEGPHGPSEVVDAQAYDWKHARPGTPREGRILYEMHFGTFTAPGSYLAAIERLPLIANLGINTLELMPVNEFPGRFNWGYDGVGLFAPCRAYGRPEELRAFVDAAHGLQLSVILDVVYNHLGPEGNYLGRFSPHYFTRRYQVDWGEAINFDGPQSDGVRDFFCANAAYWIDEFRLDGLRLDATQCLFDGSARHVIADIAHAARAAAPETLYIVAENEPQKAELLDDGAGGGMGVDALWNDDFHHCARVALTGHNEAYFSDYEGTPQEFISAAKWGFLYQGQYYCWQKKSRGTPTLGLPACAFINYLENHDQVANSGLGLRLSQIASPGALRALTALLLLAPGTPLLFQGQEFGSSAPFIFFADHAAELARTTLDGRLKFLAQFPSLATPDVQHSIPDPASEQSFHRCRLDDAERLRNGHWLRLHRDLIRLRKSDAAFAAQRPDCLHGAVLGERAFALRYRVPGAQDRLLLVNLGRDLRLSGRAEPLLAPPSGTRWSTLWSSEAACYGGGGTPEAAFEEGLHVRGHSAAVLGPA